MGLSDELREGVGPIWEQVVTHPFVIELGDNTLSQDRFRIDPEPDRDDRQRAGKRHRFRRNRCLLQ